MITVSPQSYPTILGGSPLTLPTTVLAIYAIHRRHIRATGPGRADGPSERRRLGKVTPCGPPAAAPPGFDFPGERALVCYDTNYSNRARRSDKWPFFAAGRDRDLARHSRLAVGPVLTAPVSAVPALFVTVRARPGPSRPVKYAALTTRSEQC